MYFVSYTDGTTWSPTAEGVGRAAVSPRLRASRPSAPTPPSPIPPAPTTRRRRIASPGLGRAATTLDTTAADQSYVATPSIVAMNGGTAELLTAFIRQSDGAIDSSRRARRAPGRWSPRSPAPRRPPLAASAWSSGSGSRRCPRRRSHPRLARRDDQRDLSLRALQRRSLVGGAHRLLQPQHHARPPRRRWRTAWPAATAEIAFVESDNRLPRAARRRRRGRRRLVAVGGDPLSHVTHRQRALMIPGRLRGRPLEPSRRRSTGLRRRHRARVVALEDVVHPVLDRARHLGVRQHVEAIRDDGLHHARRDHLRRDATPSTRPRTICAAGEAASRRACPPRARWPGAPAGSGGSRRCGCGRRRGRARSP